jgi:hypothetical protein
MAVNRMIARPLPPASATLAPNPISHGSIHPTCDCTSTVHLIAQEPVRPYAVIAIVSTQSIQIERARRELIKLAAQLGGHAVLLDNSSLSRIGNDSNEQQLTGKVIVYTDSTGSN